MEENKLMPREKRIYCLIGLGIFCAVLLTVLISVPIALYQARHQRMRNARWRAESYEADQWVLLFSRSLGDALSTGDAHKGLVMGSMKVLPPFNASVEERIKNQSFAGFHLAASYLNSSRHLALQALAPGGVALHLFPDIDSLRLRDFLNDDSMGSPTPIQTVDTARTAILGPLHRAISCLNVTWQVVVRDPIYNATTVAEESRKNFWGFSIAVLNLDAVMDQNIHERELAAKKMGYLIYLVEDSNRIIPIRYYEAKNLTEAELHNFIATGTSRPLWDKERPFYVCLRGIHPDANPTKTAVALIVVIAVFLSILVFMVGACVVLICLKEYDGVAHAPKAAPFALAIIGLCNAEQLWELAPDRMVGVSERLAVLQKRHIIRYNVYEAMQLHPYSTTVAARSIGAAVRMCFSLIEELQSQPIDEPLRELLGEDGGLSLACAVHWCTDATVRAQSGSDTVRYEGPDVVYCGRMWVFAAPNKVSISRAAREAAAQMEGVSVSPLASVFLRGVEERQDLFTITNPQSKRLAEASRCARRRRGPNRPRRSNTTELSSDGNPLSLGREAFASSSVCPAGAHEVRGAAASNASPTHFSREVPEARGVRGGNAVPACGGAPSERGATEAKRGHNKRSSQCHGFTTLVELVPTDGICLGDAAGAEEVATPLSLPLRFELSRAPAEEGHARVHAAAAEEEQQGRIMRKGDGHGPITRSNVASWGARRFRPEDKNSLGSSLSCSDGYHLEDPHEGDIVTEALRRPTIPTFVDAHLRAVFEQQSVILDFNYNSVRTVVFYFYSAFKLLLKPLAAPERNNIFRRLVTAFGIPNENILEHLAVRCVLRYIRQSDEARSMLWNCEQQMRLRFLADGAGASLAMVDDSSSANTMSDESFAGSSTTPHPG
ncbi:uncharacterized protein Tco025E_08463 [Trypanosoma conorhini]|uniref:CHASE domain-containing protein n=1 Tax=Trypanosoma conorhini TaxID=83891 RepID=A0A422N9E8_9TRYP|nr:uncharacterized protein Tco025E_08463 [Trypanosoma conorhini]RNF02052.1 hypothetical protein Tco025E_08463 [Trypanosoma conorhini]